jgi:RHS repeat-associated protein
VFEGNEPIFEKRISDGRIRSYVYAGAMLFARVDGVIGDTQAKKYWYHTDQVGSVKAVTNQAGAVVWNADYLPFGQQYMKSKFDASFEEDDLGFTGKGYDTDVGLSYFNARWYDADMGRFISEDPVGDPNNPNLYTYGRNNPLSFNDPTGNYAVNGFSPPSMSKSVSEDGGSNAQYGMGHGGRQKTDEELKNRIEQWKKNENLIRRCFDRWSEEIEKHFGKKPNLDRMDENPNDNFWEKLTNYFDAIKQRYTKLNEYIKKKSEARIKEAIKRLAERGIFKDNPNFEAYLRIELGKIPLPDITEAVEGAVEFLTEIEYLAGIDIELETDSNGNQKIAYYDEKGQRILLGVIFIGPMFEGGAIDEGALARVNTPYTRPANATTTAQRAFVQGQVCVDCGQTAETMVADHIEPLVVEYYTKGTIDAVKMRSVSAVQPQCPTCSAQQGAILSQFSKWVKGVLGL